MRYQPIYDIAEICARKNIKEVVLCPGSRCAPLTIAFVRHPNISTRTFSDERSAGFIALGMAQTIASPVAIVCTSGSAAYNLAPAVAEAYFSNTPLVILTADRPAEWIGQHDGQTIFQQGIFGKHVKRSFDLPQDYDHPDSLWAINRMVNEAINLSTAYPCGPVHINAPFREPLYPDKDAVIEYSPSVRIVNESHALPTIAEYPAEEWTSSSKKLIVIGQHRTDADLSKAVRKMADRIPVVHDVLSNMHSIEGTISHSDLFLGAADKKLKEKLRPDLLITFGLSLISKNLKIFLRDHPATHHWHIQPAGPVADTFKTLTRLINADPGKFLLTLEGETHSNDGDRYLGIWKSQEDKTFSSLEAFMKEETLSEITLVDKVIHSLPPNANLHLANSMSVRYANFCGIRSRRSDVTVFSNRGTSGIDGCTSTAVGHCLLSGKSNFLITGDLAFFYDRNAFWHNYPLDNLHILLLNNHGGLIFDVLDGPSSMPEAREYFITHQKLNALKTCEEFGIEYSSARRENLDEVVKKFTLPGGGPKVLEFESDTLYNKKEVERLKRIIRKHHEA